MFHRREQAEHFIASIEPSEEPPLYFMHVLLPHIPWAYLPSGKEYSLLPLGPREQGHPLVGHGDILGMDRQTHVWAGDELAVAQGRQRYLLQVGCVDRLLDRLVRRLKEVGLYDRSLVVITADHGVALLRDQPLRGVTEATGPQLMSVPLLIKLPRQQRGVISDRNVESIDVLPTMAGILGIRLPWTPEGASALDPSLPERAVKEIATEPGNPGRWSCDGKFEEKYTAIGQMLEGFGSGESPRLVPNRSALRTGRAPAGRVPHRAGRRRMHRAGPAPLAWPTCDRTTAGCRVIWAGERRRRPERRCPWNWPWPSTGRFGR